MFISCLLHVFFLYAHSYNVKITRGNAKEQSEYYVARMWNAWWWKMTYIVNKIQRLVVMDIKIVVQAVYEQNRKLNKVRTLSPEPWQLLS